MDAGDVLRENLIEKRRKYLLFYSAEKKLEWRLTQMWTFIYNFCSSIQ